MGVSTSKCVIYFSWYCSTSAPPLLFACWELEYPITSAVAHDASTQTIILGIL